jgi:hypothetical protein
VLERSAPVLRSYRNERVRVLLDTSAVRAWIHRANEGIPLSGLERHAGALSIALANNVVTELTLALYDGRVSWTDWTARGALLDRILDKSSPIFPDDGELQGTAIGAASPSDSPLPRHEHSRAIWALLLKARSRADLETGPTFFGSDGVKYRIESSRAAAEHLAEAHRERWRSTIRQVQTQIVGYHPTQDHVAEFHFKELFGKRPDESVLRARHDGYVRTVSRFVALALQRQSPYNASADKRRGDSFDIELLLALSLPAVICTLDQRLRRHVAASGSPQVRQLLTPQELLEAVERGLLLARVPEVLRNVG